MFYPRPGQYLTRWTQQSFNAFASMSTLNVLDNPFSDFEVRFFEGHFTNTYVSNSFVQLPSGHSTQSQVVHRGQAEANYKRSFFGEQCTNIKVWKETGPNRPYNRHARHL